MIFPKSLANQNKESKFADNIEAFNKCGSKYKI